MIPASISATPIAIVLTPSNGRHQLTLSSLVGTLPSCMAQLRLAIAYTSFQSCLTSVLMAISKSQTQTRKEWRWQTSIDHLGTWTILIYPYLNSSCSLVICPRIESCWRGPLPWSFLSGYRCCRGSACACWTLFSSSFCSWATSFYWKFLTDCTFECLLNFQKTCLFRTLSE